MKLSENAREVVTVDFKCYTVICVLNRIIQYNKQVSSYRQWPTGKRLSAKVSAEQMCNID